MKNIAVNMLSGFKLLELTFGPSGSYAGRLYQQSGAEVTKICVQSNELSSFKDAQKKSMFVKDEKELLAVLPCLLEQSWDVILWDSHCSMAMKKLLEMYFTKQEELSRCVGVMIDFPPEVNAEEEQSLQALAGWMELTGESSKSPLLIGGHPATSLVGAHAATAGLLPYTATKGKMGIIHVHALTIAISALEGAFAQFLSNGEERLRTGNHHSSLTPMVILPSIDGWSFIGAPVDEQYSLLESWGELPYSDTFSTAEGRLEHRGEVENRLSNWTQTMKKDELFHTGQAFRMPFSKVQSLEDIRACCHLQERNVWTESGNIGLPWQMQINQSITYKKSKKTCLRVVDLTSMWSGPYCTRLLADLGIEVLKIEAPHRPDGIRAEQGAKSPFFRELNRNKKGITLDFNQENDRLTFIQLIEQCDVLIDNFSPRVLPNFGLHTEELWEYQPNLIHLSLSAFGQSGPYKDFVGYGPTIEAMSGIASLTQYEDGKPWLPGFSISDIGAGIHGAFALLVGLYSQKQLEAGIRIDLSQYEVALHFVGEELLQKEYSKCTRSEAESRSYTHLINSSDIQIVKIDDHAPTLGMPWSCKGWEIGLKHAPELGEHNQQIEALHNKSKRRSIG